jgi:hypothetical protein
MVLMRLEIVAAELTSDEIDQILDKPTVDSYGNNQLAGIVPFLEYLQQRYPDKISSKARRRIDDEKRDW